MTIFIEEYECKNVLRTRVRVTADNGKTKSYTSVQRERALRQANKFAKKNEQ